MLDQSDPNHIKFIHEFSKKVKSSAKIDAPPGIVASKKKEEFEHGGTCPKCSKASTLKLESNKDDSSITSKKSSKIHRPPPLPTVMFYYYQNTNDYAPPLRLNASSFMNSP